MKQSDRGFVFQTVNGNLYYYNDVDGSVIPWVCIENERKRASHDDNLMVSSVSNNKEKLNTNNEFESALKKEGYNQLLLIVTEECNLRCKYCAFSGEYPNNRTHNNVFMKWETANKAIKLFYEGYYSVKSIKPNLIPAFSYYGGEPLLNFPLIKKITGLVNQLFTEKVHFNLTTNGTILTNEMLDFFIMNDYFLTFSLNGYQREHDRLRIFDDGTGTYDIVWTTLQKIRNKNPNYYEKYCGISTVYDYGTDLDKLYVFFKNREWLLPKYFRLGLISGDFTQWYSRYSAYDRERFFSSLRFLKELYIQQIETGIRPDKFLQQLCGRELQHILNRTQGVVEKNILLPYTATCLPGSKIAVYPDGSLHCCERINQQFSIGNVETGIDKDLVDSLLKKYKEQIIEDCTTCPITRLCNICFSSVGSSGKFEKSPFDYCSIWLETMKSSFSLLWTLYEKGVTEDTISPDRPVIN